MNISNSYCLACTTKPTQIEDEPFFFNLLCNNKGSAAVSVTHKHVASAWQEFSGEISHTIRSVALMASAPGRPMICKLLPSMSSRRWAHTLEFYTGILPIYITSCLLPTITSFAQNAQNAQVCAKSIAVFMIYIIY